MACWPWAWSSSIPGNSAPDPPIEIDIDEKLPPPEVKPPPPEDKPPPPEPTPAHRAAPPDRGPAAHAAAAQRRPAAEGRRPAADVRRLDERDDLGRLRRVGARRPDADDEADAEAQGGGVAVRRRDWRVRPGRRDLHRAARGADRRTDGEENYPPEAKRLGIEGKVELKLGIDQNGRVVQVKVVTRGGHGFDEAAAKAMRQARFKPAMTSDGKAVPCSISWTYRFESIDSSVASPVAARSRQRAAQRRRFSSSWTCDCDRGYPGASRHTALAVRDIP